MFGRTGVPFKRLILTSRFHIARNNYIRKFNMHFCQSVRSDGFVELHSVFVEIVNRNHLGLLECY